MGQYANRSRHAAHLSLCVGLSVSAAALAAPPDPPNAFNVGQFNNLNIAATQNIFSAGRSAVVGDGRCGAGTDGTLPTEIAVPPNAVWVSFETVNVSSPIGDSKSVETPPADSARSTLQAAIVRLAQTVEARR